MFWPLKWILTRAVRIHASMMRRRFHRLTKDPQRVQRNHLFSQLQRERDTAFGRDHHFRSIKTVADFRKHVPITKYEYFEPYIKRVMAGDTEAMFHRQQILMFAMTSGTTASRKYIPVTKRYLDDYRRGWMIWGLHMFEDHKELWFKPMLQLASDWDEERTAADIPCGSISGLTAQMQRRIVRKSYVLPPASAKIHDVRTKYYLAWRLGLIRGISVQISANPSTMVNFARFGNEHKETLLRDVHDGTLSEKFAMPAEVRQAILEGEHERIAANPEKAREIEKVIAANNGVLRPKDIWPNFGLLGNWTGGSVGAYMRHYPEYYGNVAVRDIGLIASEGRMTIPIADGTPSGILEITSSYFEFVPVDEIDDANPTILESHELQEGQDYYILLTTSSGLYRYDIHDVVRCTGFHEKTPLLAFLNKGANFSNLTGEKISEYQVCTAVNQALSDMNLTLAAFSLAPCWEDVPYYGLFVEESDFADRSKAVEFARRVERNLVKLNSEYQTKRETHRLQPIRCELLPAGTWASWDAKKLAQRGGTAEQYKHPALINDTSFRASMPIVASVGESAEPAATK